MADPLEALDEMRGHVTSLESTVKSGRSRNIAASAVQPIAREIAKTYFESVRAYLTIAQNRNGLVEEIGSYAQAILELAERLSERIKYIRQINKLRPLLLEASLDLMKAPPRLVLSGTEKSIFTKLARIVPAAAASYEQALLDISQGTRISWRGTASELRETLREVIDRLAPDDQVMTAEGFQLEKNHTGPTQKQKVRFILKTRGSSSIAVDAAVADLARTTYQVGSASTHTGAEIQEIKNIKRYIDALLGDLLEVS